MPIMNDDQWRTFVSAGTRTGKLATIRGDGSPHVAPLWFALDGDELVFQTEITSVKGRNLARDPRFALVVDDERPPYSFVLFQGTARIDSDPGEARRWAGRLGARYMGVRIGRRSTPTATEDLASSPCTVTSTTSSRSTASLTDLSTGVCSHLHTHPHPTER